ncbi:hypothetical protein [Photobacterium halotolerans]|uniref:hypothetical protein n=1 Tax=Photobacterium halotolerans TaxID=265726 RepID=UPI001F2214C8|nr:hypothetical protein [Photobacterium halotolerans]
MSSNVGDLVAAARYLEEKFLAPSLLIGHSLGGRAVISAVQRIQSVQAVATIGAPADAAHSPSSSLHRKQSVCENNIKAGVNDSVPSTISSGKDRGNDVPS